MRALGLVVLILGLALGGCGGDTTASTTSSTTTLPPGPPCFGLPDADTLPDWAGSLEIGVRHEQGSGFTDLTDTVGCAVEQGVVLIRAEDGFVRQAYVDNCVEFEADSIPVAELRPPAGENWTCRMPVVSDGEPAILIQMKQG